MKFDDGSVVEIEGCGPPTERSGRAPKSDHCQDSGTVKFGDGSVVEIEGRGTILFVSKGGEHRKLTDVYFIPS